MKPLAALSLVIVSTLAAKLPPNVSRCDQKTPDFSECLLKAVESTIRQLDKPIKEVGLPSMEPLEIPSLTIGAGTGAVAFQQNYKNVRVFGFSKIQCSKVEFDRKENQILLQCAIPKLEMKCEYDVKGKILLLPIFGKGEGIILLSNVDFVLKMNLEKYEKRGEKHFKVTKYELQFDPKNVHFTLNNLFNGDKSLRDNVVQVMNDNWKEVFADVKQSYEEAFGQIFASIFDKVAAKVSIKDLFGEQ